MEKIDLVLYLTNKCNLDCKYCFVKKGNDYLSFEKCKEIIEKYKSVISNIVFFGGEPLLHENLIYQIIDYNRKYNFNYTINTNATIINEDIISLAKSNNILLNVSLDGNEISNSVNRFGKSQFNKVVHNIKTLIDNDINTIVNYVISPNNIDYFCNSLKYFHEIGIPEICLMINYDIKWSKNDIKKFKSNLFKCKDLLKFLKVHPIYDKMDAILRGNQIPKCNFGNDTIVVSPSGKLYPCISFIDNDDYEITTNTVKFKNIIDTSKCINCRYENLCVNNCMCKYTCNTNESEVDISCETEKIFIDMADEMLHYILPPMEIK